MPSFKIIRLLVLEKKSFEGLYHILAWGHLGHVTWTIYINFRSPFRKRLHLKFGLIGQVVLEKIFEDSGYITYIVPGQGQTTQFAVTS